LTRDLGRGLEFRPSIQARVLLRLFLHHSKSLLEFAELGFVLREGFGRSGQRLIEALGLCRRRPRGLPQLTQLLGHGSHLSIGFVQASECSFDSSGCSRLAISCSCEVEAQALCLLRECLQLCGGLLVGSLNFDEGIADARTTTHRPPRHDISRTGDPSQLRRGTVPGDRRVKVVYKDGIGQQGVHNRTQ